MPKLNNAAATDLQTMNLAGSHYGYSATPVDKLTATEYTLAVIAADGSGSTNAFRPQMEKTIRDAVEGCQKHARGDNMMIRLTEFDDSLEERHGFKMVKQCNLADYSGCMKLGGSTALYDSAHNAVESLLDYAKRLHDQDYDVNAIVIVLTDGGDNASRFGPREIRKLVDRARQEEYLESLWMILVGINPGKDRQLTDYLDKFAREAGFDQYLDLADTSADRFAKLGGFISQSISSQSSSLGTGGPSKLISANQLTF
jgi:hypothetical protein